MEHLVAMFYGVGHTMWLSMIISFVSEKVGMNEDVEAAVDGAQIAGYIGFIYADLLRHQSRMKLFFKGIGVFFVGVVLFVVGFLLITVAIVALFAIVDPDEARKMFKRPSG